MLQGTVVWWDVFRGYGFVASDAGDEYFIHNKGIVGLPPGKRNLKKRQRVEFEIGTYGGRACAVNLRPLDSNDSQTDPLALLGSPDAAVRV